METIAQLPISTWCAIVATAVFAAVAHGAIGFGFPLISTPLVALFTDVRTAVLTTLLPNIVLNVISVVRGGDWLGTLRRNWPVAAYVLLGTLVGTQVLAYADTEFLKLLLASMIVVHLLQARIRGINALPMQGFPRLSQLVFGSLGGFFSGTVNVAVPPLLMYYSTLGLAPVVMTQAMNLSFLVARSTQAVALATAGRIGLALVALSVPLSLIAVLALRVGFRLQRHVRPETFQRIIRAVLWTMALTLTGQVAAAHFR
jgi:uncharacterized membrane protein YfcA